MSLPHNWQSPDVEDTARMLSWLRELEAGVPGPVYNVKAYGSSVGAGGDDTSAIQAALNAAGAGGGTVYVPAGSYSVTNLTAPTGNQSVKIIGDGPNRTFIGAAAGSTGILLDLTYTGGAKAHVHVEGLSFHLTNAQTMTALRTQNINWLYLADLNFRYGAIGWEHVMTASTGPVYANWINFQNHTSEAIHLTGSSGLGTAGQIQNCQINVTDSSVSLTQGILVDWFTVGFVFNNVQVLGNTASSFNIHTGIKYSTSVPSGSQGAFLYFTSCVTDQIDTGNGLDLTNARGIWSANNFWGTAPSNNKDGVAITGGKEQFYVNDWISGRGMSFTSAPDKITVGSGCRFPQTSTGGGLVMPASSPPTNLIVSEDAVFYTSITNDHPKLETAVKNGWNYGRGGSYV